MMRQRKSPVGGGQWAVKAHDAQRALASPATHRRRGATLIELLITMAIMAIISAAILGTASAAMESARRSRTKSLITKISGLVMQRWDSYAERRVNVSPYITGVGLNPIPPQSIEGLYRAKQISSVQRGQMLADARLLGLRELMKMEMPDRWTDVLHQPLVLSSAPALTQSYLRVYNQITANAATERAECLYLVVMNATGDGEARSLFNSVDIADTDGNGAMEFIDGWGRPIDWIRWPAGAVSDLQPMSPGNIRLGEEDHDPYDFYHRDTPSILTPQPPLQPGPPLGSYPTGGPNGASFKQTYDKNLRSRIVKAAMPNSTRYLAYRLVPLIFSKGSDGESSLGFYGNNSGDSPLDPYFVNPDNNLQPGEPDPENLSATKDNLSNHLMEY